MRKALRTGILILAGLLIIAQFFQPERNLQEGASEHDMLMTLSAPDQVTDLLRNSCYDCHSGHTRYPWYSHISPVSWYMSRHVKTGKEALNFNDFALLNRRQMVGTLSSLCEHIELGSMPLKSFLFIHRDAALDEGDIRSVCNWAESEAERIIRAGRDPGADR